MQLVLSNEVRAHERLTKVESININSKGLCCYLRYCNSVLRIAIVQVATRHHCYVQLLIRYRENSIWTFARNELLLWNKFRTCTYLKPNTRHFEQKCWKRDFLLFENRVFTVIMSGNIVKSQTLLSAHLTRSSSLI